MNFAFLAGLDLICFVLVMFAVGTEKQKDWSIAIEEQFAVIVQKD
jgi:hypothetical protein